MNDVIETLHTDNHFYDIVVIKRRGTRRISLRFHPIKRLFELSAPPRVSKARLQSFVQQHKPELESYLQRLPVITPLIHGSVIPVLGQQHEIVTQAGMGMTTHPAFIVPTTASRCPAMCKKLLQHVLLERLEVALALYLASPAFAETGVIPQIVLRDPVSRWASCSSDGRMMFSWRLAFTPLIVVNYVAAHEAAHLIHRNHSPAFWQLTRELCRHSDEAIAWLKAHGKNVFAFSAK